MSTMVRLRYTPLRMVGIAMVMAAPWLHAQQIPAADTSEPLSRLEVNEFHPVPTGNGSELTPLTEYASPTPTTTDGSTESPAVKELSRSSYGWRNLMGQGSPWHASLTVGETYDDNIFFTHRKTSDEVTDIAPTIDFEKGDRTAVHQNYLNLYLAPTFFFYARHSDQNRQDDNADLYYQYQWTRLTLGVEAGYQHETDASVDVRDLIERNIYKTSVSGSYLYSDKLVISGSAANVINSYPTRSQVDTNDRYVEGYALYQVAPKLQLGGGTRSDFVEIKGAPDESIENLLLHMKYNPGGKIEGTFVGGAQYIEFQGNAADHVLPVFELSLGYTPVDGTGFSLSAWRRSVNSYDEAGKVYLTTGVELGVSHRLWRDFYVTAGASYDLYNYELGSSNDDATSFSRRDHFYYVHGGLEWTPQTWLRIEVHYRYTADDSSNSVFSFNDNQIGFQTFVGF